MDTTRRALSRILIALAVPVGVVVGVLLAVLLAAGCYARASWVLGMSLGRAVRWVANPLSRQRCTPGILALPPRR